MRNARDVSSDSGPGTGDGTGAAGAPTAATLLPSMMLFRAAKRRERLRTTPQPRSRRRATWRSSAARRSSHAPPTDVIHEIASPSGAGVGR